MAVIRTIVIDMETATNTHQTTPERFESVTGAGSAMCKACRGKLDYSWFVKFTDGTHAYFCSEHLPADK